MQAAVAAWERRTRSMLLKSAATGAPRALDEVLRRLERTRIELQQDDEIPASKREWLEWRLARVRLWIEEDSGIARTKLLTVERDIMTELELYSRSGPMSPEEVLAALEAGLPTWSDTELLAVHAEGLRRGIPGFTERP